MGFSGIINLLISTGLIIWAYNTHKNFNYNLIDITGTVKSINNTNSKCDIYYDYSTGTSLGNIFPYTNYNCKLTVEYTINSVTSTVDVTTSNSTEYTIGKPITVKCQS